MQRKTIGIKWKNPRLIAVMAAVIIILLVTAALVKSKKQQKPEVKAAENSSIAEKPAVKKAEEAQPEEEHMTFEELEDHMRDMLEQRPGEWSMYLKDLGSGDTFLINDRTFYPASTIKLFAMAAAYQQIYDGNFLEETLFDDISAMASKSNNDSFNNLVWDMGNGYITEWCAEHGYKDTFQYSGLRPADNADGLDDPEDRENQTSAKDIGRLLESIYNGECVSHIYSARMINLLLEQEYRDKIPAGIPDTCAVANKTGETDDVTHDCAIVSTPKTDYILVIMCDYPGMADDNFGYFSILSQEVYNYFK